MLKKIPKTPNAEQMERRITNNIQNLNQPTQQNQEQRANSIGSPPVPRASPVARQQETANTGLPRRRIKWTQELNVSVLKAYFKATRDQSIVGYRQQMYQYFLTDHPELGHITEQNLADRRAAIVRNNLIPMALREEIRQSVLNEVTFDNNQQASQPEVTLSQRNNESQEENVLYYTVQQPQPEDITANKIKAIYNEAKIKYLDMGQGYRPYLPKLRMNRRIQRITTIVNTEILPAEIPLNADYNQLIGIIYCSAYTITQAARLLKQETPTNNYSQMSNTASNNINSQSKRKSVNKYKERQPAWKSRLIGKIEEIRKDLGYITSHIDKRTGKRTKHKLRKIKLKYQIHTQFDPPNHTLEQIRDTIRQKLYKYTARLRNYTKSYNRSQHNRIFQTSEKLFYSTIAKPVNITTAGNIIDIREMETFWKTVWSEQLEHNKNATWISTIYEDASFPAMNAGTISPDILRKAISKLHNWKQPGTDKIHNYYYKYLTKTHPHIIRIFNNMLANPNNIQPEMCAGITYLQPKCQNPTSAAQYRPITCLNTGYKLLTSCLAIIIGEFCESNNIIAEEQKGCRRGTKGCKDQLIIDSVVTNQAIRNKKNLYMAFIDYQKAFDSVPHSWLIEALQMYKIDPVVIQCIRGLMSYWRTTLHVLDGRSRKISQPIQIHRGIYQGDSLSPLLFCIALNPLSLLLKQSQYGYRLKTSDQYRVCHCFYIDDLKLYASTKQSLKSLIKIVETFTNDIRMKFGIDKCRTQNVTRGKYSSSESINTNEGQQIAPLQRDEYYKYLGVKQSITIDHTQTKKEIEVQFTARVYEVCKSGLNGRNLIKAINTYAIPVLSYTFGILRWSDTDLVNIDRKVRTILTRTRHHHPKSSIERINIPRKLGGRGLLNIQMLHDKQINNLLKYFTTAASTSVLYRSIVNADDRLTPLNLRSNESTTSSTIPNLIRAWNAKPLHGKYPNYISQQYVDLEKTNNWLLYGNLFSETEGFIIAIQDGVIQTRNYRKYIMKDNSINDDKCRRCGSSPETIAHLLNGCTSLVATHYKQRHDNVGRIIHIQILKNLRIRDKTTPYYKYTPEPIIENQRYTIYWDRSILANNPPDTSIPNRPDMVIIDKQERTARIIDFAVPFDNNILDTIATKKTKYHRLSEYLRDTQNLQRTDVIPVIVSSLGTVPKETTVAIEKLDLGSNIITELQKAVLIKAATIMRETIG